MTTSAVQCWHLYLMAFNYSHISADICIPWPLITHMLPASVHCILKSLNFKSSIPGSSWNLNSSTVGGGPGQYIWCAMCWMDQSPNCGWTNSSWSTSRPALGSLSLLYTGYQGSSLCIKWAEYDIDHHLYLALRLILSGSVCLQPIFTIMACVGQHHWGWQCCCYWNVSFLEVWLSVGLCSVFLV